MKLSEFFRRLFALLLQLFESCLGASKRSVRVRQRGGRVSQRSEPLVEGDEVAKGKRLFPSEIQLQSIFTKPTCLDLGENASKVISYAWDCTAPENEILSDVLGIKITRR